MNEQERKNAAAVKVGAAEKKVAAAETKAASEPEKRGSARREGQPARRVSASGNAGTGAEKPRAARKSGAKKPAPRTSSKGGKKSADAEKKDRALLRREKREKRRAMLEEKREKRLAEKQKREAARAEKRVEAARLKAEKKNAAVRLAAAKKKARERRRRALAEKRAERKREREKLRAALRNESREGRKKRIAAEKRERKRLAEERRAERRERRRLIAEQRRTKRRERAAKKESDKGWGGWLAAVISLGVLSLALGSFIAVDLFRARPEAKLIDAGYRRSYYDLVRYVDDLDVNMSKLAVSDGRGEQIALLSDVRSQALLAAADLERLPIREEDKHKTVKFINQLGDYANTLETRLARGGTLSEEDRERIGALYRSTRSLRAALSELTEAMGDGYDFSKFGANGKEDLVLSSFRDLENDAAEYPSMIYDGPFSDGLENAEVKGLRGEEVSAGRAEEKLRAAFGDYGIRSVALTGEVGGRIAAYNFEAKLDDGTALFCQISKKGGEIVGFNLFDVCSEERLTKDECAEIGENFLLSLGIRNMRPVWINVGDVTASVNFAYEEGGVIFYSDLIKLNVCMQKGRVTGMEAAGYYTNHTARALPAARLGEREARSKVSPLIEQETCRLALIPLGNDRERLAYEIGGSYDGNVYYAYIDAESGEQIRLLRVVSSTEGDLMM